MLHNEILDVIPLNVYKKVCDSCKIYITLFAVFSITSICISSAFIYFNWYLNVDVCVKLNPSTQTTTS